VIQLVNFREPEVTISTLIFNSTKFAKANHLALIDQPDSTPAGLLPPTQSLANYWQNEHPNWPNPLTGIYPNGQNHLFTCGGPKFETKCLIFKGDKWEELPGRMAMVSN